MLKKVNLVIATLTLGLVLPIVISPSAQASPSFGSVNPGYGWNTTNRALSALLSENRADYPSPFLRGTPGTCNVAGNGRNTAGRC